MKPDIELPIDHFIPQITQCIGAGENLVITAAPGAGKTTRLPPALLSIVSGKILVLEPRRMAAIAAAHRIAEEKGWQVGEEIGYQVRFANKTSARTRLIFMTEALLARQMIHDPELAGVDVVILDEFHERSLHVDLTLGLLRELQELGRNIQIVVMSATLESEKISQYLGSARTLSVPGRLFELSVQYQKGHQLLKTQNNFYENLSLLVREAASKTTHDVLIFLPGVGEIERARGRLSSFAEAKNMNIVPLHGSLPLEAQRKALQKSSTQRLILATNIAESSVTLDGVNTVIDSGLAKVMKQDLRTGFSRLELSRISLSSAIQRSGRAARQFPGVSYRMWNKSDELLFSKSEVPEIMRSDLSESLLFLAAQGVRDFTNFSWFERPSAPSIERAIRTLRTAGALTAEQVLTELGRQLLHFPLPVRLANMLVTGLNHNCVDLAARIAALLQERDILKREAASQFLGDNLECDISARLSVLKEFLNRGQSREGNFANLQLVAQGYQQILQLVRQLPKKTKMAPTSADLSQDAVAARQILFLSAYGDRLCRRRKNSDRARMVGGRGVKLSSESLVRTSEFFISVSGMEASSDAETLVSLASGVEKDFLLKNFTSQITKKKEIIFDQEKEQFYQQEFKALWDLPLEEPSLSLATPAQLIERLPEVLADAWENSLKQNQPLANWVQKISFLRAHNDLIDPDLRVEVEKLFEEGTLKRSIRLEAFTQAAMGESKMAEVLKKDLVYFFESIIPEKVAFILQTELPTQLKMPSSSLIAVHYPVDKAPYLEVRIQEVFGWMKTPTVLFKKIPIVLHLLSPNFRPVQITSNLESFWQNGYPEVRKELRLRYPKHQWPEDPADGIAEAKGRRRF